MQADQHDDDDCRRRDRRVGERFVPEGDHDRAARHQFDGSAGMLMGRKTYEGLAGFWPRQTGEWADLLNPLPNLVASRTLQGATRMERHGDRRRRRGGSIQAEGRARRRPAPDRLRRFGELPAREQRRRRAPVLASSRGLGRGRGRTRASASECGSSTRSRMTRASRSCATSRPGKNGVAVAPSTERLHVS
jgi:hypothetical protein